MRVWRQVLAATVGVLTVAALSAASASPAAAGGKELPVVPAKIGCAALTGVDFSGIPGAPTKITSATVSNQGYEFCDVKGVIAPKINFQIQLPTKTWTQRYLQTGCGGFCGAVGINVGAADGCAPLNNGEFVTASDDTGHTGATGTDGRWAKNDPLARIDFGFRSEHVMSVAAKRVIKAFYGQSPAYSYFDSCSNGGRQALMEAQRFPTDFDGIIAGAPANIWAPLVGQAAPYVALANRDAAGKPILGLDKLAPLHKAVLAACDAYDGLNDGQISDPRKCGFDPASVACPAGVDKVTCLTPAQVITVRKFYDGVRDKNGVRLYPGALEPGSELAWAAWEIPVEGIDPPLAYQFGENYLKYMAYPKNPPDSFTLKDTTFDARTFNAQRLMDRVYGAENPDLSAFRNAGGKLILWHGWADTAIPPRGTLAYRQAMEDRMGGYDAVQKFSRLFMLPQVAHCGGGDAPDAINLVDPMLAWVETGVAPSQIIATLRNGSTVVRTRPVYNYPIAAQYNGDGNVNDAASFHPVPPKQRPNDHIAWLGRFH